MTVVSKGTLASNWAVALKLPLARARRMRAIFSGVLSEYPAMLSFR